MQADGSLILHSFLQVNAENGGFFVSRGRGTHPDRILPSYELIFVQQGVLHLREGRTEYAVGKGEALVLWPNRRHAGTQPFPLDLRFYWVHFTMKALPKGLVLRPAQRADSRMAVPKKVLVGHPDRMEEIFRRFLDDQDQGDLPPLRAALHITLLLSELLEAQPISKTPTEESRSTLHAHHAEQFIRTHFHESITTTQIAQAVHCNPDYLGRVYHRVYGVTLTDAIHAMRMKHACRLLRESDASVKEVARESGYGDTGYFRRVFRQARGLTPSRYRHAFEHMHVNTQ